MYRQFSEASTGPVNLYCWLLFLLNVFLFLLKNTIFLFHGTRILRITSAPRTLSSWSGSGLPESELYHKFNKTVACCLKFLQMIFKFNGNKEIRSIVFRPEPEPDFGHTNSSQYNWNQNAGYNSGHISQFQL